MFIFPRFHNDLVGHIHTLRGENVEHVPNNTSMIAMLLITRSEYLLEEAKFK